MHRLKRGEAHLGRRNSNVAGVPILLPKSEPMLGSVMRHVQRPRLGQGCLVFQTAFAGKLQNDKTQIPNKFQKAMRKWKNKEYGDS